jgi:hypothetical protein
LGAAGGKSRERSQKRERKRQRKKREEREERRGEGEGERENGGELEKRFLSPVTCSSLALWLPTTPPPLCSPRLLHTHTHSLFLFIILFYRILP